MSPGLRKEVEKHHKCTVSLHSEGGCQDENKTPDPQRLGALINLVTSGCRRDLEDISVCRLGFPRHLHGF